MVVIPEQRGVRFIEALTGECRPSTPLGMPPPHAPPACLRSMSPRVAPAAVGAAGAPAGPAGLPFFRPYAGLSRTSGPAPRPTCPPPTSARASAAPRTASKEAGSEPTTTPPPPRQQQLLRHAQFRKTTSPHFTCFADTSERCHQRAPPPLVSMANPAVTPFVNRQIHAGTSLTVPG